MYTSSPTLRSATWLPGPAASLFGGSGTHMPCMALCNIYAMGGHERWLCIRRLPPAPLPPLPNRHSPFTYVSGYKNRFTTMIKYLVEAGCEVLVVTTGEPLPLSVAVDPLPRRAWPSP